MDHIKLPTEKACEPEEEASQPTDLSPKISAKTMSKCRIRFTDDVGSSPKSSQRSNFKDVLSQPPPTLTHRQRLKWLQERRTEGLWVQCDSCDSWRYIPHVIDSHDLPKIWYCSMNPDPNYANCFVPEVSLHIRDEEDLIHAEYSAGSVVWARLVGWPWWPAMVDDCPDTEQFYWLDGLSDIPTYYNVVFFDSQDVTRAWVAPANIEPFGNNKKLIQVSKEKKYKKRLDFAVKQANEANALPLSNRLVKFSFLARFKGKIISPRKIKRKDLKKHQSAMKRKFNVEFPLYSSDSDNDSKLTKLTKMKENGNNKRMINTHSKKNVSEASCTKKQNIASPHSANEESTNKSAHAIPDSLIDTVQNSTEGVLVELNSTSVQVGNTNSISTTSDITSAVDNDTSATYIPDTQPQSETVVDLKETLDPIASPSSGDFDF